MRIRAWAPALLAGFACVLASTAARAADETRIGTVAGYDITRVNNPKDTYPCRMVRGYADPKDNNAANALAFGELEGILIVSLVYEHWKWPADTTIKARLSVDRTLIDANAPFLGNATYLAIRVPASHLPTFNTGKKIILGFKDGTADFDLTGFKPAFEATQRCNRDAAAAKVAGTPVDTLAAAARIGSGIAATPPAPAPVAPPAPKPAVPAPVTAGPLPSEDRTIAYLFGLYDRWAFDVCDMRTTAKQRSALDGKMAALQPEMAAIEPALLKELPNDPARCPPSSEIEGQLKLLLDTTPEDFVARMDGRAIKEFRGIVQPILARLKPAAPPPPPAPAPVAASKPLPGERRIAAYLLGLTIQDVLQRCDFATTARQRSGVDAKLEALRPEMTEVESTVREAMEKPVCPGPDHEKNAEKEVAGAINGFIETSPEDFAAAIDAKRDGKIMKDVRRIVETLRPSPPTPSQARMSAYLWGLLLRDKIAECDIATTARQRTGLDAKIASMKEEMSTVEGALRAQIEGQVRGCPKPETVAEMAGMISLFIESTPEDFAAAMDRRSAKPESGKSEVGKSATGAAAAPPAPAKEARVDEAPAAQAPAKDEPAKDAPAKDASAGAKAKPASCGETAFPQSRAALVAALKERLQPLGVQDIVERPGATQNHHRYALTGADVGLDVDGADGTIKAIFVGQSGDGSKEAEIVLAAAAYLVATFTRAPEDGVAQEMKTRLGAMPTSAGQSEKFDTATVYYTKPDDGHVTMLIDNADAGDCTP